MQDFAQRNVEKELAAEFRQDSQFVQPNTSFSKKIKTSQTVHEKIEQVSSDVETVDQLRSGFGYQQTLSAEMDTGFSPADKSSTQSRPGMPRVNEDLQRITEDNSDPIQVPSTLVETTHDSRLNFTQISYVPDSSVMQPDRSTKLLGKPEDLDDQAMANSPMVAKQISHTDTSLTVPLAKRALSNISNPSVKRVKTMQRSEIKHVPRLTQSSSHEELLESFIPDVGYFSKASKHLSRDIHDASDIDNSILNTSPISKLNIETSPFTSHQQQPKLSDPPTLLKRLPGGLLRTPSQVNQTQQLRGSNPRCFLPFRSLTVSKIHDHPSTKEDKDNFHKHYLPLQPNFILSSPERTQLIRQKTIDDIAESQRKQRISRILSAGVLWRSTPSTGLSKAIKSTSRHGSGLSKHARNPLRSAKLGRDANIASIRPSSSFRQVREAWA